MAEKAKHAFGALERIDESIQSGVLDSYDVLFVKDAEGKPYVGWISKDGQKEIVDPYTEVAKLETQIEAELATKASSEEMTAKIDAAMQESVEAAKAYADQQIEDKIAEVGSVVEIIEF